MKNGKEYLASLPGTILKNPTIDDIENAFDAGLLEWNQYPREDYIGSRECPANADGEHHPVQVVGFGENKYWFACKDCELFLGTLEKPKQ